MVYVNFVETFFAGNPCGIKENTSIKCETLAQAEELYKNAAYANYKARKKGYKVPYKYLRIAQRPRQNSYMSTYEQYTKLHDE